MRVGTDNILVRFDIGDQRSTDESKNGGQRSNLFTAITFERYAIQTFNLVCKLLIAISRSVKKMGSEVNGQVQTWGSKVRPFQSLPVCCRVHAI